MNSLKVTSVLQDDGRQKKHGRLLFRHMRTNGEKWGQVMGALDSALRTERLPQDQLQ